MSASPTARGVSLGHESWKGNKKKMFIPLTMGGALLLVFFLGCMSLLFGSVFEQRYRAHALNVLVVDFDGGAISESLSSAYDTMKGNTFPTLQFQDSSSKYSDPSAVKEAVCLGDYWGAVYVHQDASSRLSSAVAGDSQETYNPNDTITYIFNEARYTTTADSMIRANLEALISASSGAYYETEDGQSALQKLDRSDRNAVQAFLNPIRPSSDIIVPTQQGARAFYNTLNVVFPIILSFFFVNTLNGVGRMNNIWARLRRRDIWLVRFVAGKIFSFLGALVITAYIWAFREDWPVNDSVFPKNWMIVWFQMDIHWQVFDSLLEGFIPMQFAPLFMMTWVLSNVASAVTPFAIAPGFYRAGYALPGYSIYSLQVRAWTGCTRELHINLPVLFAWWLLGLVATVFSVRRQSANAQKMAANKAPEEPLAEEKSV